MNNFLSEQERFDLKKHHKKERDKRVCDRIKAVLLYDEGWSYKEISHVLLLSDEVIRIHIEEYKTNRKLTTNNGGSVSKLNNEQIQSLVNHLEQHTYLYAKDIVHYVKSVFDVTYTVAGMTNFLKTHNFSYKKPAIIPGKMNYDAQKTWVKKYEELKNTLSSNETICFIDGVHPTHNSKLAYGWIRKGKRKELRTNTGRQRLNLSGAIDIFSKKVIVEQYETLNAASIIKFLQTLEIFYPEVNKIHVFCDNAKYYKNNVVDKYLKTSKIKLHFLPPYSPNLNPIERLWKFVNEKILYNKYYEKFIDFKNALFGFFKILTNPPNNLAELLKKRITDNFKIINPTFANS